MAQDRRSAADPCAMAKTRSNSKASPRSTKASPRKAKAASRSTKASTAGAGRPKLTSRAVLRDVEPGSTVECALCGERVKFQAKMRHKQVICNVYVGKRWDRVEHYHAQCYTEAGEPHGEVDTTPPVRRPRSPRDLAAKEADGRTTPAASAS